MNLWKRFRNKKAELQFEQEMIERSVLESLLSFLENLSLPDPALGLQVQLLEPGKGRSGRQALSSVAPYCLLLYVEEGSRQYLNGGYAAGQAVALLRFQGIAASILREFPEKHRAGNVGKGQCIAAVAFGRGHSLAETHDWMADTPCICSWGGKNWAEEVTALAKKEYPAGSDYVRMVRKDGQLHIVQKGVSRRNALAEFEAGLVLASVMAAADALWIDLEMQTNPVMESSSRGYLISFGRCQDRRPAQQAEVRADQERASEPAKNRRWGYA